MILSSVLENVGYEVLKNEPLEQQIIHCFLDMVDSSIYADLDYDQAKEEIETGEITFKQICKALNRL